MNYKNPSITNRSKESALWKDVETQESNALPFMLERYLLLENWKYSSRLMGDEARRSSIDDMQYVHHLLSEAVTVLLSQEERIRKLERAAEKQVETVQPQATSNESMLRYLCDSSDCSKSFYTFHPSQVKFCPYCGGEVLSLKLKP